MSAYEDCSCRLERRNLGRERNGSFADQRTQNRPFAAPFWRASFGHSFITGGTGSRLFDRELKPKRKPILGSPSSKPV
jgi:hypothetical protein